VPQKKPQVNKDLKTKRLIDFETKKSIHINLTRGTHAGFKKFLFDYGLSMQEVFEHFASLVAEEDNNAVKIVVNSYKRKRDKIINKVSKKEAENLYDAISHEDPFER
jgi:hypothetical protein